MGGQEGGGVGVGGGWEAKGRQYHPQWDRQHIGSSLTHHVALLVPLSGSIDPVVDHCGFTGSAKDL